MADKDQERHAPEQSGATEQPTPAARKPTPRDIFMKKMAENPARWKEAPKTGQGFIIGGVKR